MALTVDPATKVFSILQADLTFVSGTLYELDTAQFKLDVMALLASEAYIWMPFPYAHNSEYTIVGTTYARSLELINGFSVTFEDTLSAYSVRLINSNNNLFDVDSGILNPTDKVTVIGQNAAGLIVGSGSGVTQADIDEIADNSLIQSIIANEVNGR